MTERPPFEVVTFGHEQQPIVVVDDFFKNPEALREQAYAQSYEKRGPFYPGIRASANPGYLSEVSDLLTQILKTVFGFKEGAKLVECNFSLVTALPQDLIPIQCLPHFDGTDPGRIAVLHYLSQPEQGGTAFYRHKQTGFETVTADRYNAFEATLQEEARQFGLPTKQYFTSSNERYEQIGKIDAAYNRCIIYRGITLHSGDIPDDFSFDANPSSGRLTVNTFLAGG